MPAINECGKVQPSSTEVGRVKKEFSGQQSDKIYKLFNDIPFAQPC